MRVHEPGTLQISRDELLADVRERLAERSPALLEQLDPAHPAWMVLEQAAWMVEALSTQLDEYPYAVIRQFAHLLGAELHPAQPALGMVVVSPATSGVMDLSNNPAKWRFMTQQTEEHGMVEYALAERVIPVHAGRIQSLARLVDGELYVAGQGGEQHAWVGDTRRSMVFSEESVRFTVQATDIDKVEKSIERALESIRKDRGLSWLQFSFEREEDRIHVDASIIPGQAFTEVVAGVTQGGDVVSPWGLLDDTTWTPPVRIAEHPLLPARLRGRRPLPGDEPGLIVLPDVPANIQPTELVVRDARPAPVEAIESIWSTIAHMDSRLLPLRPGVERKVVEMEGEPDWVSGALRRRAWYAIADVPDQTVCHVEFDEALPRALPIRVGWIVDGTETPRVRAFAIHPDHGVFPNELPLRVVWELPLPDPKAHGMVRVISMEAVAPEETTGLLVTMDGEARAALFNPLLIVNAPVIDDGRLVPIDQTTPNPISLMYEDTVDRGVLDQLCAQGLPPSVAKLLQEMNVAQFSVEGRDPVIDYEGVYCDPAQGLVVLNAPDDHGITRALRRGEQLTIEWYRRTDASEANLDSDEINIVEQDSGTEPRLLSAINPVGTSWGADREADDAAVERIFGPQTSLPVTSADWERVIRQALGTRSRKWIVRVWSHAERALVSHTIWPPQAADEIHEDRLQLIEQLKTAGPGTLLVVLGPSDAPLNRDDLDWARQVISGLIASWRRRIPVISDALVAPVWPLRLRTSEVGDIPVPSFGLRGLVGTLIDLDGRNLPVPRTTILLNAAVVEVEEL